MQGQVQQLPEQQPTVFRSFTSLPFILDPPEHRMLPGQGIPHELEAGKEVLCKEEGKDGGDREWDREAGDCSAFKRIVEKKMEVLGGSEKKERSMEDKQWRTSILHTLE